MTDQVSEALKPCPFCGVAIIKTLGRYWGHPNIPSDCIAQNMTMNDADIAAWNTRAPSSGFEAGALAMQALCVEAARELAADHASKGDGDAAVECEAVAAVLRNLALPLPASSGSGDGERSLRPEVLAFAHLMEQQLRANDHKPGWKNDLAVSLLERLREETDELEEAIYRNAQRSAMGEGWIREDTVPRVAKEAADVANFAMMIADVSGALTATNPLTTDGGRDE